MAFWIAAAVMTATAALLLVGALLRGRADADPVAAYDLRVYRDQLTEVDRDQARGIIAADDAERLRTEVSRRVLDADRALRAARPVPDAPRRVTVVTAGAVTLLLAATFVTYARIGAPDYPDMPLAQRKADADRLREGRPLQALAESQSPAPDAGPRDPAYVALVEQLRSAVAARPGDLQGLALLAQNEAGLGNFAAAHAAQTRLIAQKADAATGADYATLADLLILAAGGYVSPEAETALTRALEREPQNGIAAYYSGLMFAQTGRPDLAFRIWEPLLARTGPDAPWSQALNEQLPQAAALAGVAFTPRAVPALPPAETLAGPDAAAVAAAGDMTPVERTQMVAGMVAGLAERLAAEGGSPGEWGRLIGAYAVLGDTDRARTAWTDAQRALVSDAAGLAEVRVAAVSAGVAE